MNTTQATMKLYIDQSGEIVESEKNPDPSRFKLIPKTLGVEWHDDQSCNQVLLGLRIRGADYVFNSREDKALTEEYADQLAELLF